MTSSYRPPRCPDIPKHRVQRVASSEGRSTTTTVAAAARDRITKRRIYAQAAIVFYWLIDPALRAAEALALRDGVWVELGVFEDTATARVAPFDAIELEIGRLFLPKEADEI